VRDVGGEREPLNYDVHIERTTFHLGGELSWFLCPAVLCGRRVTKLYAGRILACGGCNTLAYAGQRECPCNRAMWRVEWLRAKMNWASGIGNGPGPRPLGMHRQTCARFFREHEHWCRLSEEGVLGKFGQYLI
jgi:hypothetical protein